MRCVGVRCPQGARIMLTEGPHAVVYAEWLEAPGQPTVLIYGCVVQEPEA